MIPGHATYMNEGNFVALSIRAPAIPASSRVRNCWGKVWVRWDAKQFGGRDGQIELQPGGSLQL